MAHTGALLLLLACLATVGGASAPRQATLRAGRVPYAAVSVSRTDRMHGEGFVLVKEESHCGTRGQLLSKEVDGAESCAALAEGAEVAAFSLGIGTHRGRCYAEQLKVDKGLLQEWDENRVEPRCPSGAGWTPDSSYDFYAVLVDEAGSEHEESDDGSADNGSADNGEADSTALAAGDGSADSGDADPTAAAAGDGSADNGDADPTAAATTGDGSADNNDAPPTAADMEG